MRKWHEMNSLFCFASLFAFVLLTMKHVDAIRRRNNEWIDGWLIFAGLLSARQSHWKHNPVEHIENVSQRIFLCNSIRSRETERENVRDKHKAHAYFVEYLWLLSLLKYNYSRWAWFCSTWTHLPLSTLHQFVAAFLPKQAFSTHKYCCDRRGIYVKLYGIEYHASESKTKIACVVCARTETTSSAATMFRFVFCILKPHLTIAERVFDKFPHHTRHHSTNVTILYVQMY